jgi:serine/threonine-protein kinase RsbT
VKAVPEQPEGQLRIASESDLVYARMAVRQATTALGFGVTDVTRIVTAVSELTRNILRYAGSGSVHWQTLQNGDRLGIEIRFVDQGPGIADVELALQEGYSTSRGLGLGLPGAKRLMDEMAIQSEVGRGTTVTLRKWLWMR